MKPLRVTLVDDEQLARRGLSMRLANIEGVEIVAECGNGQQALAAVAELAPDLLFLDIQMPGMNGFEVIERLQGDESPLVVFVTAHDEFAVDAFKVHAVDYLLKPVDETRLGEAVTRARQQLDARDRERERARLMAMLVEVKGEGAAELVEQDWQAADTEARWPERITVRDGQDITLVPVADIRWVDAAGDYMCLHTPTGTHIMRITMKQLEAMLDPERFLRVHRSTLVNRDAVTGAQAMGNGEFLVQVDGDTTLKASRGYRDRIKAILAA